jgi:hypothetical protein
MLLKQCWRKSKLKYSEKYKMKMSWQFPDNGGGSAAGFNDGAMDHFKGQRLSSVVREVVQNSLDARLDPNLPVRLHFFREEIESNLCPEVISLNDHVVAAKETAETQELQYAVAYYDHAIKKLNSGKVQFLCIHDMNTHGLTGSLTGPGGAWFALTKGAGLSQKMTDGSLGSFGHGSKAPFALSDIRTVFYYTEVEKRDGLERRFQGKSILQSHIDSKTGKMTQGTGFFGHEAECAPLIDEEIPSWAVNFREDGHGGLGTSIYIPHTFFQEGLYPETAITIIANYYFAIASGNLEVNVGNKYVLTKETVATIYKELKQVLPEEQDEIDIGYIYECFKSVETIVSPTETGEQEVPNFGLVKWFLRVADDIDWRGVAIARQNGMLITRKPPNLLRFSKVKNFDLFVCILGNKGSELLKLIENPQHDNFQFDRIDDPKERDRSKRRYQVFSNKIREIIARYAGLDGTDEVILDDLSDLFSEISDSSTDKQGSRERSNTIQLSLGSFQFRPPPPPPKQPVTGTGTDDKIKGGGKIGGDGTDIKPGGDNPDINGTTRIQGPADTTPKKDGGQRYKLENLRMRPLSDDDAKALVFFDAPATGKFALEIHKSGEIGSDQIDIVLDDGTITKSIVIEITEGNRESVALEFSELKLDHAIEAVIDEIT